MGKKITIRAVAGRAVRDPITKALLPSDWATYEDGSFWQKRIAQGDVEVKTDKPVVRETVEAIKEEFVDVKNKYEGVKKNDQL